MAKSKTAPKEPVMQDFWEEFEKALATLDGLGHRGTDARIYGAKNKLIQAVTGLDMRKADEFRQKYGGLGKRPAGVSVGPRLNNKPPTRRDLLVQVHGEEGAEKLLNPPKEQPKEQPKEEEVEPIEGKEPNPSEAVSPAVEAKVKPAEKEPVVAQDGEEEVPLNPQEAMAAIFNVDIGELYREFDGPSTTDLVARFEEAFPDFEIGSTRSYKQKLAKMKNYYDSLNA